MRTQLPLEIDEVIHILMVCVLRPKDLQAFTSELQRFDPQGFSRNITWEPKPTTMTEEAWYREEKAERILLIATLLIFINHFTPSEVMRKKKDFAPQRSTPCASLVMLPKCRRLSQKTDVSPSFR